MSRIVSRVDTNYETKRVAFPYQNQAFMTIRDLDYSAIFHEQGLGKTKIAIDLILYWLQKRDIDTVMVVTKKQLVKNWQNEFEIHTYIKPRVLSSNKSENFYVLNSPARVIITNFETVSTEKNRITLFLKSRNVAIIIDESTKLKNPEAKLTKNFFDLSSLFKIKTIMTGTPVANRPYDIWSQIYFLDHGKSLGTDFEDFKKKTDLRNDLSERLELKLEFEDAIGEIFSRISPFSIRETKQSCAIQLPQKIYETVTATPEKRQLEMYSQIMNSLEIEVKKNGNKVLDDDSASLKRLLRLNQVASNPALIDDNYKQESGKEQKLEELLRTIVNKDEKCIVWSCFIENINYFAKKFKNYNPRRIHGKLPIEDRNRSIEIFKQNPECKVLFATPQAAKEGLTLTVANNVIFYDRGFNLDDYLQAQDRIHRISQTKTCFIYNLILENSIDVWIDSLLQAKQYAAFLAQGDIDINEYRQKADYSYGDLIRTILSSWEEQK